MKKKMIQRLGAFALAAVAALQLTACGNADAPGTTEQKEWVYVPEFITIDEEISYYGTQLSGNELYYLTWIQNEETGNNYESVRKYSLVDGQTTSVPLAWPEDENSANINSFTIGTDGSIYAITYDYVLAEEIATTATADQYERKQILYKFDAQGNLVYSDDMAKRLGEDLENSYLRSMMSDAQGRLYLCADERIWLYDEMGNYQGEISLSEVTNGWVDGMGRGKDGKVYISYYNNSDMGGYSLTELDFAAKKTGATYGGFVSTNNDALISGIEKDFLVFDNNAVYEYDLATQTKEKLFEWIDSDIDGSTVRNFGVLEDGRFVVVYQDWNSGDSGMALLSKTKGDQVAQKETIWIASLFGDSDLQSAAVQFNKSSDKYRISIKRYMPDDYSDSSAMTDALANMNNDLTSKNCPDIIDLTNVNIGQLAAKGVFEDLNPYLDKSTILNRSGLVESVLNAYTYNDILVSVPISFAISSVMGSAADLGGQQGWTIDEMIDYADAHPDAQLFDRVQKNMMMQYLMMYNESAFIDWSTGECKFDSDQFKSLLQFVNRFPDEIDWSNDEATAIKIQNGQVLLDQMDIYDFDSIQLYLEEFEGQGTCIGFPTVDGSSGHALYAYQAYAITSKSKNKDGAWEFIEGYLAKEDNGRYWNGFPTVKSKLNAMMADAMEEDYYLDENGNKVYYNSGESVSIIGSSSGGWSYTYHTATQEEVDMVLALIEDARAISYNYGGRVINIINEEVDGFYKGQKSVDEVANVIQSRVKMYVEENR